MTFIYLLTLKNLTFLLIFIYFYYFIGFGGSINSPWVKYLGLGPDPKDIIRVTLLVPRAEIERQDVWGHYPIPFMCVKTSYFGTYFSTLHIEYIKDRMMRSQTMNSTMSSSSSSSDGNPNPKGYNITLSSYYLSSGSVNDYQHIAFSCLIHGLLSHVDHQMK